MRNSALIAGVLCISFSLAGFAQSPRNSAKPLSPLEQALISNTKAVPEAQKGRNVDLEKRRQGKEVFFCWQRAGEPA